MRQRKKGERTQEIVCVCVCVCIRGPRVPCPGTPTRPHARSPCQIALEDRQNEWKKERERESEREREGATARARERASERQGAYERKNKKIVCVFLWADCRFLALARSRVHSPCQIALRERSERERKNERKRARKSDREGERAREREIERERKYE